MHSTDGFGVPDQTRNLGQVVRPVLWTVAIDLGGPNNLDPIELSTLTFDSYETARKKNRYVARIVGFTGEINERLLKGDLKGTKFTDMIKWEKAVIWARIASSRHYQQTINVGVASDITDDLFIAYWNNNRGKLDPDKAPELVKLVSSELA